METRSHQPQFDRDSQVGRDSQFDRDASSAHLNRSSTQIPSPVPPSPVLRPCVSSALNRSHSVLRPAQNVAQTAVKTVVDHRKRYAVMQLLAAAIFGVGAVFLGVAVYMRPDSNVPNSSPSAVFRTSNGNVASLFDENGLPNRRSTDAREVDQGALEPAVYVAETVVPSVVSIATSYGQGSGIIWNASEGYIVTNHHVIMDSRGNDATDVLVTFSDGITIDGQVVGSSASQDVAVIQIDPLDAQDTELVQATFAPTGDVQVGQIAIAVGSPFDLSSTVTAGIVSSIRINLYGGSSSTARVPVEMIQTDAPINQGNSGGALANREGHVIGMNTSIQTAGTQGNVGVGFAVPSDTVILVAERIIKGESLELGYLGISSESGVVNKDGVLVTEVVEGSPAGVAGLEVGDVITGIRGTEGTWSVEPVKVGNIAQLSAIVKLYRPGEEVILTVLRDKDDLYFLPVTLGSNNAG